VIHAAANYLAETTDPNSTLAGFGHDAFWLICIKVLGVFIFLVVMTLFSIVFERKIVSYMQQRIVQPSTARPSVAQPATPAPHSRGRRPAAGTAT